ncbi:MAG: flagellar motor protein MotB [Candidatus Angelobacter sp. Gp1-AA117]|nr:MAG: flagellar motor protein MotB [Candidatus Angelobacter sp. Gp1-AA117]
MKKSYLLSLPLAAALVIPAAAQNSNSSSDQQSQANQAQSQQTQQAQPADPAATGHEPLKYERHEGFWGKLNPFARKKYVSRQLDPIRGRVNELDELTAKNAKMIADVDGRATEGIRNAMSKANDADTHALDAGNRATQAQQTAQQATTRLATVEQAVTKIDTYEPITQAEIHFRPGQAVLSKKAKDALDEMATSLKNQKGYIIEVQGFSPGRGSAAIDNSRQMAQSVVRYLVLNHEVPVYRIYTVGMGNAPIQAAEGKKTRVRGGRVEISLLKNGLGDLAANAPASAANGNGGVSGATNAVPSANSNEVQQPAAPATNVAPAPQQGGMTTEKPSPATSKPPRQ